MIYFMREIPDGLVKIGWSINPTARRGQVKPKGKKLHIIRLLEAPRWAEYWFHHQFAHYRQKGEWFRFDPMMLEMLPPDEMPSRTDLGFVPPREKLVVTLPQHEWEPLDQYLREYRRQTGMNISACAVIREAVTRMVRPAATTADDERKS